MAAFVHQSLAERPLFNAQSLDVGADSNKAPLGISLLLHSQGMTLNPACGKIVLYFLNVWGSDTLKTQIGVVFHQNAILGVYISQDRLLFCFLIHIFLEESLLNLSYNVNAYRYTVFFPQIEFKMYLDLYY